MDFVAAVAIGQDFAQRDWDTNESRWLYGKAYDAPLGLGPVMLRREDLKDINNLQIETWVNGVLVQVGNTRDMEFNCGQILEYVSRFMTLFPGDVILTGRPPPLDGFPAHGVPVQVGDKVTCRISEIGTFSCTLSEANSESDIAQFREMKVLISQYKYFHYVERQTGLLLNCERLCGGDPESS